MNNSIPFPNKLFEQYLKDLNLDSLKKAPFKSLDTLFKKLTDDFRNEIISLEDFSTISNEIYSARLIDLSDEEWAEDSGLKIAVEIAADLSYKIRHPDETLIHDLNLILSYPDYTLVEKIH
jgi:hypothetical protein